MAFHMLIHYWIHLKHSNSDGVLNQLRLTHSCHSGTENILNIIYWSHVYHDVYYWFILQPYQNIFKLLEPYSFLVVGFCCFGCWWVNLKPGPYFVLLAHFRLGSVSAAPQGGFTSCSNLLGISLSELVRADCALLLQFVALTTPVETNEIIFVVILFFFFLLTFLLHLSVSCSNQHLHCGNEQQTTEISEITASFTVHANSCLGFNN